MKKFSILVSLAVALLVALCTTSCNTFDDSVGKPTPEAEYYVATIGFGGEIEVGYEPLARSNDNNDLYGINVYSAPATYVGETPTWEPYACGLFDNVDNVSINLLIGYQYKFVASMVKDGKEKIRTSSGDNQYDAPFERLLGNSQLSTSVNNNFTYGLGYMYGLYSGFTWLKSNGDGFYRPNAERYYGELEGYIPGDNGGKAKIQMKRTSFGAKFIAKGNNSFDGTLSIQIQDAPLIEQNLAESTQIFDVFTFHDVRDAWLDSNYSETVSVVLNHIRTDNTMLPLGTHSVTFKRNATAVINVHIGDGGEESGVGFEILDEGEMTDDTEYTVENGEIVETEVGTNK